MSILQTVDAIQIRPQSGALCCDGLPSLGLQEVAQNWVAIKHLSLIKAWLFSVDYDGQEVAVSLWNAGFRGLLTLVCGPLPRPDMVLSEIRPLCPGVTVALEQKRGNDYEAAVDAATAVEKTAKSA